VRLGEEQGYLEVLPVALRHYGRALECGHRHIQQSLPRLLTLLFEFGGDLAARRAQGNKERVCLTQARAGG